MADCAPRQEWGVMHPDGTMLPEPRPGYPFTSRRFASALAAELDDDCECRSRSRNRSGGHRVMVRDIPEWRTT